MNMRVRLNKIHPALKHGAYCATTLLPGEDAAAFEKLRRNLVTEFAPEGALEESIVTEMAHLIWRKQNLATFRIAALAQERRKEIVHEVVPSTSRMIRYDVDGRNCDDLEEGYRATEERAKRELGDAHELIDVGEPATFDGLMEELGIRERLNEMISKCLKQLVLVRGIKSLPSASSSPSTRQISGSQKATG
jgi:hypothetical protein